MADKKMTPKWWLHKSNTKAAHSAQGFLDQYREFLLTGELASVAAPIIERFDSGSLLPTPAIKELQNAVIGHIFAIAEKQVEEQSVEKQAKPQASKNWLSEVFNSKGELQTRTTVDGEEELSKDFDLSQACDRWTDRRLVLDCGSDCYGEITHLPTGRKTYIHRQDALARFYVQRKGPTCVKTAKANNSKLGFVGRAKQDRASFSRG